MSAVLGLLKNSTKDLHDRLESVSYAQQIMSKQLSLQQYYEIIYKNYLIYKQLEPRLNKNLTKIGQLFPQRFTSRRLKDLENDLKYFKSTKKKSPSTTPFKISEKDAAAWLGVLYVLEGSRLGGNVIVKALKDNPNLKDVPEFHFYQQKEINIRDRWVNFQQAASKYILSETQTANAINAANFTFQYFYKIHQSELEF